ncbi:MAG: tetratricopeptide repeat protein [Flavobacteriales bacterium]|nr:tetratricopeptide repeat protein [Flavobacteriales bacterium]
MIDSLEIYIQTARDDTAKISALNTISNFYARKDPDKAHDIAWESWRIANELHLNNEVANIYGNLGYIYMNKGEYKLALEYVIKASKLYMELNDQDGYGNSLTQTGRIYREMGDYELALEFHRKASDIFEKSDDKTGMGLSYDNVGGIYREQGNYESALSFHLKAAKVKEESGDKRGVGYSYDKIGRIYKDQKYYKKALEFHMKAVKFKEESDDKKGLSYTFGEIGNIYGVQGQFAKALKFHFKAAKIRQQLDDQRGLSYTLSFIGKVFEKQGNYEKALEYYLKSSNLCEDIGNKKGLGYAYDQIGKIYADQGRYEAALAYQMRAFKISEEMGNKRGLVYTLGSIGRTYASQANYVEALKYQQRSLDVAKSTGSKVLVRDVYKEISSTQTRLGHYKEALESYLLHTAMKDSVLGEESLNQMANMESKYQAEKKDKEISLLKMDKEIKDSEAKKQRILLFSSLFALVLASALAFLLFNRFKLKRKANEDLEHLNSRLAKTNLELDMLSLVARKTDNYVIISNGQDQIEWVNEGFTRITGYESEEVLGKLPSQILRGTLDNPEAAKIIKEGVEGKKPFSVEILNYAKDDKPIWLYANVTPILDDNGEVVRYISVGSDVTERKETAAEMERQKKNIEEKNKKISESINYALRIQQSILPTTELIQKHFPQSFMMYYPKDVVSGDFPWFYRKDHMIYIAAVDCTGHGVPGAFMSIIGHSLLNEIVKDQNIEDPAIILSSLHEGVNRTLKQNDEESKSNDGMEVALCKINLKTKILEFSGANRPLYFVSNGELTQYKGDKVPIGGNEFKFWMRNTENKGDHVEISFTNHQIKFKPEDSIFICSDGLADQFGGPKKMKFGPKRIRETILANKDAPMEKTSEVFNEDFQNWKGDNRQMDDILLIGLRF